MYKLLVIDRNTWNHTTVYKLLVIDRNTWNHTTVYKLLVIDRNTWNHTTVCKLLVIDRNTWNHISAHIVCIKKELWQYEVLTGAKKKSYGDMIHFYLGKWNFPFIRKLKNLYTLKEIEESISKVSTNQTFKLSKQKVNRLRGLSVRWPNDISCSLVRVNRSDLWFLFRLKWKEILLHKAWAGILN